MAKKINKTEDVVVNTEKKTVEEQTNNIKQEIQKKELDNSREDSTLFKLNQKIIAITTLISYYINTAKANEGYYEHNHNELYLEAKLKISELEFKKNETIKQLEKIILGNVKENMD